MDRIGKFVIQKTVAARGCTSIFLAQDPDLRVPVAIKSFTPASRNDGAESPAMLLNRFMTEARILAGLDHPQIISVKGMDQTSTGGWYFVMPCMAGNLFEEIGKDVPRRLPLARALSLSKQLAGACWALHRRGLVHRWLKPSNILLTARENGAVKLADFSMVKLHDRNLPLPDQWQGDAEYTAPEQMDSATTVDARADVYSLGLLMRRMSHGALPGGDGPGAAPALPQQLTDLIEASLSVDPARRPAHAGEVMQALDKIPVLRPSASVQVLAVRKPGDRAAKG